MESPIKLNYITGYKKAGVTLLFLLSCLSVNCQYVGIKYSRTKINYLSLNYEHNFDRHWISGGLAIHLNTTIDDDFIRIYNQDFHSYNFEQHLGLSMTYGYDLLKAENFTLQVGFNAAYFPTMGLKRYVLVPIGFDSNNEQVYSLDKIEIEKGSYVLPTGGDIRLCVGLTTKLRFTLGGSLGVMFNGNFSNSKIRINISGSENVFTQVNSGIYSSLQYLLF